MFVFILNSQSDDGLMPETPERVSLTMLYLNFRQEIYIMRIKPIASNMTELLLNDGTQVLFSYETPVACFQNNKFYKTSHKWSRTTSKHIGKWANMFWNVSFDQWHDMPQDYFNNLVKGV
jgi:hypothetical protein